MKKYIYLILLYFSDCTYAQIITNRVDSLNYYYELCIKTNSDKYKTFFFDLFPNNFDTFISTYGFIESDTIYFGPLYTKSYDHISLFCSIGANHKGFEKKLINIVVNGYWQVDAINHLQNCIRETFFLKPEDFLSILKSRNEHDIFSFWTFYYDNNSQDIQHLLCLYRKTFKLLENDIYVKNIMDKAFLNLIIRSESFR